MHCTEFLQHYSDFRDARLTDPHVARQMRRHLLGCRKCMRYHAQVLRGVTVFKTLSDLEPSSEFRRNLARRLLAEPIAEQPVMPASAGLMVALMVATGLALVVWDRTFTTDESLPPPSASIQAPVPAVIANAGIPFVSFTDLSVPPFGGRWRTPGAIDEPFVSHTAIGP
jgi:hypothetical protein